MSQELNKVDRAKIYLKPTVIEVILLLLMVLFLFGFFAIDNYRKQSDSIVFFDGFVNAVVVDSVAWVDKIFDAINFADDITLALYWALFGAFLYVVFWSIFAVLRDTNDNVAVAFHYVHPRTYDTSKYWTKIVRERIYFALLAVFTIFYTGFFIKSTFDFLSSKYIDFFNRSSSIETIYQVLFAGIVWLIGAHFVVVLIRMLLGHYYINQVVE